MLSDSITSEDLKIKIHHVGGIGGYGPTTVLSKLGHVKWVIYDAEKEALKSSDKIIGGDYLLVNKCIGNSNSKGKFNVMFAKSASSMFEPEPSAKSFSVLNRKDAAQIWGIHTKIVKTIKIDVWSLDWLVEKRKVPNIDFLSMDTQGAEIDILNGASKALKLSILGIVCETDFWALYRNQPLFGDIQNRLRKDEFRFFAIYNHQSFNTDTYPKELLGRGFLAVGESLFLKDLSSLQELSKSDLTKSLKLAACAVAFDQLDFAISILNFWVQKKMLSLEKLSAKTKVRYIKMLRDLYVEKNNIEMSSAPINYESTNSTDVNSENGKIRGSQILFFERILANLRKIKILTHFMTINVLRRLSILLKNENSTIYYSKISAIYDRYGFSDLAKIHDRRCFLFDIFSDPGIVDDFIKWPLNRRKDIQLLLAQRNYFKGKYL